MKQSKVNFEKISDNGMGWTNFHSHCYYCDGKGKPAEYLKEAISQGLLAYGFSSHAPLPFHEPWSMPLRDLYEYVSEIRGLKHRYFDEIQVYIGLEVDYIPNEISPSMQIIKELDLDYVIGSVHFVDRFDDGKHWEIDAQTSVFEKGLKEIFNDNIKEFVYRYYELIQNMVVESQPDVVGHLDKFKIHNINQRYFDESESWYQEIVNNTLEVIQEYGSIVEINTRGMYKGLSSEPYPSYWIIQKCHEFDIPLTINSDCHHSREISSKFDEVLSKLKEMNINKFKVLFNGEWQDKTFDKNGLVLSRSN